jgi:hypothetical protein
MAVLYYFRRSQTPRNTQEAVARDVEKLKQANVDDATTGLHFENYDFDEDIIVRAVIDLFHRAFKKDLQLDCLRINKCTGRIDEILQATSSLDMFDMISISGDSEISQHGFWSISAAMKFNKQLTKLDLNFMDMTRQQAAALGAGLITSNSQNHFKELRMYSVRLADGAIAELASGLKHNSSLCILNLTICNLGDARVGGTHRCCGVSHCTQRTYVAEE